MLKAVLVRTGSSFTKVAVGRISQHCVVFCLRKSVEKQASSRKGQIQEAENYDLLVTFLSFPLFRIDGSFMESALIIPKPLLFDAHRLLEFNLSVFNLFHRFIGTGGHAGFVSMHFNRVPSPLSFQENGRHGRRRSL